MRRALALLMVAAACAGAFVLSGARSDGGEKRRYVVELDNAFGMVLGGDVRIAGVNAGEVTGVDLDEKTLKALVEVEIDEVGFGSLRTDARCETRPQSPLGEYFLDCAPGTNAEEIEPGGRVRVERTTSTIPPDLVQNTMRLPYRERFRLVINEFGAGLAGRPRDLNEAIRRGVPALRQTARLLSILADHNKVIRDLAENADTVITKLAANRRDVGRFVDEAEDTASASAERADDIATNFQKLPRFVRELKPTMAALGEAAVEQRPVLVDLSAAAEDLERFLDNSGEFATAARPSIRALGELAPIGREAVEAALPNTRQLRKYAAPTPDLAGNLRITLEDFADPDRVVEKDPRSPGGRGFTGPEAILAYVFNQSMTVNAYDEVGHMVRAAAHTDHCSAYRDASKAMDEEYADCRSWLGPTQPGLNAPDPSPPDEGEAARARTRAERKAIVERAVSEALRQIAGRRDERRRGHEKPSTRTPVAPLPRPDLPAPPGPIDPTTLLDFLLAP